MLLLLLVVVFYCGLCTISATYSSDFTVWHHGIERLRCWLTGHVSARDSVPGNVGDGKGEGGKDWRRDGCSLKPATLGEGEVQNSKTKLLKQFPALQRNKTCHFLLNLSIVPESPICNGASLKNERDAEEGGEASRFQSISKDLEQTRTATRTSLRVY